MKYRNASKVVDCIDKWNNVRQIFYLLYLPQILIKILFFYQCFFERRKIKIVLMKGRVDVSGQNEYLLNDTPTSSSSNLGSAYQKYYEDHPPSSNPSISQELVGKNDDTYRLFVVPLS